MNKYQEECVFLDRKPSKMDVIEIFKKTQWDCPRIGGRYMGEFIDKFIVVEKLSPYYEYHYN